MAVKRQREAEELARNALRELRTPSDFSITQEERLQMRNIPYFLLPSHETVPKTGHIGAKVDTHNSSYTPACQRPTSAPSQATRKVSDYSHVRAKVYTGRKRSDSEDHMSTSTTQSRFLARSSHSTPSLHRFQTSFSQQKSSSTSQLPARPSSASSKYKSVKPRVNSFDNIHHTPGGGNKKVSTAKATTPTKHSPARVAWESTVNPSEPKTKLQKLAKEKVRSKIDTRDPNPAAHKLKHTLEELALSHGTKVNPRFAERRDKGQIVRRYSSGDVYTERSTEIEASKKRLRKSVTLGGLRYTDSSPSFLQEIVDTKDMDSNRTSAVLRQNRHKKLSNGKAHSVSSSKIPLSSIAEDEQTDNDITVEDIEVSNTDSDTTVFLKNILARSSLAQEDSTLTQTAPSETKYYEVDEKENQLAAATSQAFPHGIPRLCVIDDRGELVEVVVDPPQSNEELNEEGLDVVYPLTDQDQDLVALVINSNNPGFNDDTTSTKL